MLYYQKRKTMEIIKSNADFIKKYGQFEFYEMCKFVPQDLAIARISKNIGGYKINNTKKRVIFYRWKKIVWKLEVKFNCSYKNVTW